jgi:hypothetical protein
MGELDAVVVAKLKWSLQVAAHKMLMMNST